MFFVDFRNLDFKKIDVKKCFQKLWFQIFWLKTCWFQTILISKTFWFQKFCFENFAFKNFALKTMGASKSHTQTKTHEAKAKQKQNEWCKWCMRHVHVITYRYLQRWNDTACCSFLRRAPSCPGRCVWRQNCQTRMHTTSGGRGRCGPWEFKNLTIALVVQNSRTTTPRHPYGLGDVYLPCGLDPACKASALQVMYMCHACKCL